MKSGTFFPYPVPTAISLVIKDATAGAHIRGNTVDAWSDKPATFGLTLAVRIDGDKADRIGARDNLVAVIRLRSIGSQSRTLIALEDLNDTERVIEFSRDRWLGAATVTALILNRAASAGELATDAGAIRAWSSDITICFDPPASALPGDHLDVRWKNFTEDPALKPWRSHLFSIDFDGDLPVVFLNSHIPEAYAVLSSRATRGRKARIRDVTFNQVAHQVWSSLIATALANLAEVLRDDPDGLADPATLYADLRDLDRRVLTDWAPYLCPGSTDPEQDLIELVRDHHHQDLLVHHLPHAIQGRFKTVKGFDGLVREAGLFGEGEET